MYMIVGLGNPGRNILIPDTISVLMLLTRSVPRTI